MCCFDSVVIGAGVAGMTSAIYLKRYQLNVLLLEKNIPGGQIVQTPNVENYPGFTNIDGASLALNIFEQVKHLDVSYQYGNVVKIEDHGTEKWIYTEDRVIRTKSIVLALGRKPRKLGLKNENELIGKGISWCATCDGIFYKDQNVAVVGGGNSALEEALFLSNICKKVEILYRGETLRADSILYEKALKKENIEIHYHTEVIELISSQQGLTSIKVLEKQEEKEMQVNGLFIYIGFEPDTDILKDTSILLKQKYVVVNEKMETNIKGIFACGDVIKKDLYQLTTAVGEASIAASQIKNYIIDEN